MLLKLSLSRTNIYFPSHLFIDFCGGALISPVHILTSAHCLVKLVPNEVVAVLGILIRTDISNYALRNTYNVSKIIMHEEYKGDDENDVALIVLSRPVNINDNVSFICLPEKTSSDYYFGKVATAVGWGLNRWSFLMHRKKISSIFKHH
jgi:secreted trypsin-like serine protease